MVIMQKQPNPSGAYSSIQSWSGVAPPDGYYQVLDNVTLTDGGFGALTVEDGIVTAFTPDVEAWERWQAEHPVPEPQPSAEEDRDAMLVGLEYRMTLLELGVNE
jgi:hypothetical protein